jgi:hypothetical protein
MSGLKSGPSLMASSSGDEKPRQRRHNPIDKIYSLQFHGRKKVCTKPFQHDIFNPRFTELIYIYRKVYSFSWREIPMLGEIKISL